MIERLRKMFFLAARKGYRNLVLGAWGCGAFGNDTRRVAEYFRELLMGSDCFDRCFDNVKFAILGDEEKIEIFKSVFRDKIAQEASADESANDQNGQVELFKLYQSDYDYPMCNHTEGVTAVNIGFARGVTASGVPFEAEVSNKDGVMTLAVVIPAIFNDAYEDVDEDQELSDENINITTMHYDVESFDYSILDLGMVDDAMEENTDVVRDYVNFLIENGIVVYASNLLNGSVLYRTDALGNSLAKVLITMQDTEGVWAYTDLLFEEFPTLKKRKERLEFTIVKK
jgi:hypothetical protein